MYQQFYTNTLMSGFVKHLLSTEDIPTIDSIQEGDSIISNCLYLYDGLIIKCVTGGLFHHESSDILFPSDTLFPSTFLFAGIGYVGATYKVMCYYTDSIAQFCKYRHFSKHNYYDGETHYHLGQYLRHFSADTGINLMPYYNCNINKTIDGLYLVLPTEESSRTFVREVNTAYKVIAVPVKFDKAYTIAINCTTPVLCQLAYYGENELLSHPAGNAQFLTEELYYSFRQYSNTSFARPFVYRTELPLSPQGCTAKYLYDRQRFLYLLIQVPSSNESSLVVLEGDYTHNTYFDARHMNSDDWTMYNPSLLMCPSSEVIAFSDRLIEYLLWNVIHSREMIPENVRRVQEMLYQIDEKYRDKLDKHFATLGTWDADISKAIIRLVNKHRETTHMLDMDGNINKDVEILLQQEIGSLNV